MFNIRPLKFTFICTSDRGNCECVCVCLSIMLFGAFWCSTALNLAGSSARVIYHSTALSHEEGGGGWGHCASVSVFAKDSKTQKGTRRYWIILIFLYPPNTHTAVVDFESEDSASDLPILKY